LEGSGKKGRWDNGTSGVRSLVIEGAKVVGDQRSHQRLRVPHPYYHGKTTAIRSSRSGLGVTAVYEEGIYGFSAKNPNDNGGQFHKGLSSGQWKKIRDW